MKNIVLIFLLCYSYASYSEELGIAFEKDSSLIQALNKADKENKLVFVDCFANWCAPCIKLSKEIFIQKEVGDFYNDFFISISVNMTQPDTGTNSIMTKYDVRGFPTLIFLNPKGEILLMHVGGGDVKSIIELGNTAIKNITYLDSLKQKIIEGDRSAKVLLSYLYMIPFEPNRDALIKDYFKTINDEELINSESWELFYKYLDDINCSQFKYFINNRKEFEEKYRKPIIEKKILQAFDNYINKNYKYTSKILGLKTIDSILYLQVLKNGFKCGYCASNTRDKYCAFILKTRLLFEEEKDVLPSDLSSMSWYVHNNYKKYNDTLSLKDAKKWAYQAYYKKPEVHEINYIYAHILFDTGNVDEAIKFQNNAIKLATKQKSEKLDFYREDLKKFEANRK